MEALKEELRSQEAWEDVEISLKTLASLNKPISAEIFKIKAIWAENKNNNSLHSSLTEVIICMWYFCLMSKVWETNSY